MFAFSKLALTAGATTGRAAGQAHRLRFAARAFLIPAGSPAPARADEHRDRTYHGADAGGAPPRDNMCAGTGIGPGPGWLSFRSTWSSHSKRAWPHWRAGSVKDTAMGCARASCAGR